MLLILAMPRGQDKPSITLLKGRAALRGFSAELATSMQREAALESEVADLRARVAALELVVEVAVLLRWPIIRSKIFSSSARM